MPDYDIIVIGGGMIGAAVGFGLARLGQRTAIFDEGDVAFRAARGNFGLVWVQGKGKDFPAYADWTRRSAEIYGEFIDELDDITDTATGYDRPGGIYLCLSEQEFAERGSMLAALAAATNSDFSYEMLDHEAVSKRLPGIGPSVVGGSYSPQDGLVNPLYLLRAMHAGFAANNGRLRHEAILDLAWKGNAFAVTSAKGTYMAGKIVLAAGLGNHTLACKVGLQVPVYPERGQILVTEKLQPFLHYPTLLVRQTVEGAVLLGDSHEEVGFDEGTSTEVLRKIAHQARVSFPLLERARIIRMWGALRVLTPDGIPIYDQSSDCPGAFSASAHSGVTLSAVHALHLAKYVVQGKLPGWLDAMSERRFHVH